MLQPLLASAPAGVVSLESSGRLQLEQVSPGPVGVNIWVRAHRLLAAGYWLLDLWLTEAGVKTLHKVFYDFD